LSSGLGATLMGPDRTLFRVWAPAFETLELELATPLQLRVPLLRDARGYHEALVDGAGAGTRYFFRVPGGLQLADPTSRYQPEGVHGPSEVVDLEFDWHDQKWRTPALCELVTYELHVGTFTRSGTFEAVIDHLPELVELGVTAIELMPIAQFAGEHNWGYDGVFPFAAQNSYGGPLGLMRLVDAAHENGIAVVLDVVYNHVGPEGNQLHHFGPYFNGWYRTPWGEALNFDAPGSDDVRHFFIENARQWLFDFHIDALRLDAVHAIRDASAYPFLTELADRIHEEARARGRQAYLIAESDLNDPRVVRPRAHGGHGLDAQWSDDFHHALHTLLTGEAQGYYADFGDVEQLAKAYRDGFVYTGQHSAHRQRRHGAPMPDIDYSRIVVSAQNHDQVGNRMLGDRLSGLVSFEAQKLAAACVLTAPFQPLLFMGEEYGELAPFPYFVQHSDPRLVEAVRRGRLSEFESFDWNGQPPDPQADSTFASAQLSHHLREHSPHRELLAYYRHLLKLRRHLLLELTTRPGLEVTSFPDDRALLVLRRTPGLPVVAILLAFNPDPVRLSTPLPNGVWYVRSDSAATDWAGPGTVHPDCIASLHQKQIELAPWSALVLEKADA
jgi:maltooligosyltrehalose trehalohydrolase